MWLHSFLPFLMCEIGISPRAKTSTCNMLHLQIPNKQWNVLCCWFVQKALFNTSWATTLFSFIIVFSVTRGNILLELKELFAVHLLFTCVFFFNLHCHARMTHVACENFKSNLMSFIFRAEFAFFTLCISVFRRIVKDNGYCSKEANWITLNYLRAVRFEFCETVVFSAR